MTELRLEGVEFEFAGGVPVDEFPITMADGAVGWLVVEVRVVPDERGTQDGRGRAPESGHEAVSVDDLIVRRSDARHREEGRKEVLDDERGGGAGAGPGGAGPIDNHRNAGPTFVGGDLVAAEREVPRALLR